MHSRQVMQHLFEQQHCTTPHTLLSFHCNAKRAPACVWRDCSVIAARNANDLFLDFANFGVRFWDLCSLECYQTYSSIPVFICCLVCNVLISKNHSFLTFSFTFSSFSSALSDAVRAFSWRLSTGSFSHCQPTSANWRARPQRSPE